MLNIVSNWRNVWKTTTVLLSGLLALLSIAQAALPVMQDILDKKQFALLSFGMAILIGILRYVAQPATQGTASPPPSPPNA